MGLEGLSGATLGLGSVESMDECMVWEVNYYFVPRRHSMYSAKRNNI